MLLAYPNIVFDGQSLVATASYHPFDDRNDRLRPGPSPQRAYLNWHDLGTPVWQWEPAGRFFSVAYREGRLPLWDTTIAGGVDAHVNLTQGQYFPPYVALLLAGNGPALRDAYFLLVLAAAGGACFLLLHAHGMHPLACATAATFLLGGTMTQNVSSIMGQAAATIPLMVLAMDRYLAAPSARRAALVALAVALAALSSFMPIVACGLAILGIQLVVHAAAAAPIRAPRLREAAAGGAAVGLGLAAAAFLLVPVFVATRADPAFRRWYAHAAQHAYAAEIWPQLLSRVIPFSVTQGHSPYLASSPEIGPASVFDVGVVSVLAALLASSAGREDARRLVWSLAASAAFLVAKLFALPPAQWIAWLPVVQNIHFRPYAGAALGFCVSVLAAVGVDSVVRRPPAMRRVAVLAVVLAALAAYGVSFAATHDLQPGVGLRDPAAEAARLAVAAVVVVGAAGLRARGALGGAAAGAAILAALLVEMVPLARVTRNLRADVWTDVPPYVRFLQSDPGRFRVHSIHVAALTANLNQGVGIDFLSSRHSVNPRRYQDLVRRYFKVDTKYNPITTSLLPSDRVVLDIMNVRYVVAYDANPGQIAALEGMGLATAFVDGRYVVLRNPSAWPRAYVAFRPRVVDGSRQAVAAVGGLRSTAEVVLEETPRGGISGPGDGECQIREHTGDRVAIDVVASAPALVVLSENYDPGWTATVNGAPARVLPANAAFRAVEVPAGRSRVEFRYRPRGWTAGLLVSAAALAAIGGMALRKPGRG